MRLTLKRKISEPKKFTAILHFGDKFLVSLFHQWQSYLGNDSVDSVKLPEINDQPCKKLLMVYVNKLAVSLWLFKAKLHQVIHCIVLNNYQNYIFLKVLYQFRGRQIPAHALTDGCESSRANCVILTPECMFGQYCQCQFRRLGSHIGKQKGNEIRRFCVSIQSKHLDLSGSGSTVEGL